MNGRASRRGFLLGAAALALPIRVRAEAAFAPSAATLARPAAPIRNANGLQMRDGGGSPRQIAEFVGKIVVLSLWGPWCLPCRREMPSLARLADRLDPGRAVVLPLAFDWRGAAGVRRFYRETAITNLPVLVGDGDNLKAVLGIENLPTTVLLNATGQMIARVEGEAHWDDDATLDWISGLG